jgi:hypothetical protein
VKEVQMADPVEFVVKKLPYFFEAMVVWPW